MTERGLKNVNVFYSTFTDVFFVTFLRFLTFYLFIFFWNVFYMYALFYSRCKPAAVTNWNPGSSLDVTQVNH